jgi:cytochrome c-type biogenesis protein CcmF
VMVQERRGMLKVWNLGLVVGTFALTVLGTFLTRGSILSSVHTFAQSIVGPMYLAFLTLVLVGGFGLIAWRREALRADAAFDTPLSRESVFLGNNVLLLAVTFTVLVGTIYPLLAEAITGDKVSVGGPYFNRNTTPVALLLLFLMAIGPLLPWRAASPAAFALRLRVPAWVAAITCVAFAVAGAGTAAIVVFGLAAFVGAATVAEMLRGVRAQRRARSVSWTAAARAAIGRNRRLYGGLLAHLGILVALVGVSWAALGDGGGEVALGVGDRAQVEGYEIRLDRLDAREEPHRRVLVAHITAFDAESGEEVVRLQPSLNLYPGSSEPIGTPSIRVGTPWNGMRDLYASLVSVDIEGPAAALRFVVNPGIGLLWVGGFVIAIGGLVAAWPARARPFRTPLPEEVAEAREEVRV